MILAVLALAAALERPELLGVACSATPGGATVKVLASGALEPVTTERAGTVLAVAIPAGLPAYSFPLPPPVAPVVSIEVEGAISEARLRIATAPGATFESRVDGALLTLVFRSAGAAPASSGKIPVEQLYPLLFPGRGAAPGEALPSEASEGETRGWRLGPVTLKPGLAIRYVDADSTYLDTPMPVRGRYIEVQPSLGLVSSSLLLGGRLNLGYEPRLRLGEDGIPVLKRPSHFFTGSLDLPLGSWWWFTVGDQLSRGSVETDVVDPGREYFFDVRRFRRNQLSLGVRSEGRGRFDLSLGLAVANEDIEPGGGYFSNDRRTVNAALRYELGPELDLSLRYSFERVPPPEGRPVVESSGHTVGLALEGEPTPLIRATLSAGFLSQANPRAPRAGDSFRGLVFAATASREFPSGAQLSVGASRATQLSAFENNAFYVSSGVQTGLIVPLPASLQANGGVHYRWNGYRLDAQATGDPRSDRLFGWTLGLGRPLTSWSYLRVDYSRDRRTSSIPGLSTSTRSLLVTVGIDPTAVRR